MPNQEIETNTSTTEPTEEKYEQTPTVSPGMTAEEFNRAFSAREKALMSKLEKKFSGPTSESNQIDSTAVSGSDSAPNGTPDALVQKLQRQVQDMAKREKAANQAALQANVRSEVTSLLKDKVSGQWLDIAVDKVASSVHFEDSVASIQIDDVPYSLQDGVSNWIGQEGNKRFLPPKATQKSVALSQRTFSTSPGSKVSSQEDEAERMAAALEIFEQM